MKSQFEPAVFIIHQKPLTPSHVYLQSASCPLMTKDFPAFEIIDGDFSRGLLLICDHACNAMPDDYGTLGLPESELKRHIAYDIGADGVTRGLAMALGVPAVLSTFSRLLIDPNRGEDDPTLVRQLYDGTVITGNYPLTAHELAYRIASFHRPYHRAIEMMSTRFVEQDITPALLSVHSMTDMWNGEKRPWETAILWDTDPRFAIPMIKSLRKIEGLTVGDNEPYDGALAGDTLFRHGTAKGFSNALIEIRQDLIRDESGISKWVDLLAPIVEKINQDPHNHEKQFFGTRTGADLSDFRLAGHILEKQNG